MADADPGGGGGGLAANLKAKFGPLPVWGWLGVITVVLLGYWLYEQHKNAGQTTAADNQSAAQVGQPGVVVINQDEPGTPAPQGGTPPPEPKKPTGGSPNSPHKVTRAEAQTALKGDHTVYTRNRGGTYVPVTSLAGVHDTLFVGEKEWDKLAPKTKAKK
jgi:hypothetical protein